jgi:hypothetical protein
MRILVVEDEPVAAGCSPRGYMVVRLNAQDATMTGFFTNAIAAEVRDASNDLNAP